MKHKDRVLEILDSLGGAGSVNVDASSVQDEVKSQTSESGTSGGIELFDIHNGVIEFRSGGSGSNVVKTYVIPNYMIGSNSSVDVSYNVFTVAYNTVERKTVSNFSMYTKDKLKSYLGIDIDYVISENLGKMTITADQACVVASVISSHVNIIRAACTSEDALYSVLFDMMSALFKEGDA